MKFIILFEDNLDADSNIRKNLMPEHLTFLEANSSRISAAGPLSKLSGEARGGLWLVETNDASEIERLVHEDPFWPTGLRKSYTILKWTQVYSDGARLI